MILKLYPKKSPLRSAKELGPSLTVVPVVRGSPRKSRKNAFGPAIDTSKWALLKHGCFSVFFGHIKMKEKTQRFVRARASSIQPQIKSGQIRTNVIQSSWKPALEVRSPAASNCTWQQQRERREPWCIAFFCSRSHTRLLFAPPGAGRRRFRWKWRNWWWSLSPSNWFFKLQIRVWFVL